MLDDDELRCKPDEAYLSYEDAYSRSLEKTALLLKKIRESDIWENDIEATM